MSEQKIEKLYKKFYGHSSKSEYIIDIGSFKILAELGKVNAIEYNAKKHNDRKVHTYRHVFKKKPILLTNGKDFLIVGDFEIKEEGITG